MASNKVTNPEPAEPPSLFERVLQSNPLALGLVALIIGAIIGLLLPETERENALMGPKRDELLDKGREAVEELRHKAEAVAGTAQTAAQDALTKVQGAATEALDEAKSAAQEAVTEAKGAVTEVIDSVKEEAKHQGLVPGA